MNLQTGYDLNLARQRTGEDIQARIEPLNRAA